MSRYSENKHTNYLSESDIAALVDYKTVKRTIKKFLNDSNIALFIVNNGIILDEYESSKIRAGNILLQITRAFDNSQSKVLLIKKNEFSVEITSTGLAIRNIYDKVPFIDEDGSIRSRIYIQVEDGVKLYNNIEVSKGVYNKQDLINKIKQDVSETLKCLVDKYPYDQILNNLPELKKEVNKHFFNNLNNLLRSMGLRIIRSELLSINSPKIERGDFKNQKLEQEIKEKMIHIKVKLELYNEIEKSVNDSILTKAKNEDELEEKLNEIDTNKILREDEFERLKQSLNYAREDEKLRREHILEMLKIMRNHEIEILKEIQKNALLELQLERGIMRLIEAKVIAKAKKSKNSDL